MIRLSQAELVDTLRLIRTQNVGPVTFFQLLARFGSPEAALNALPELSRRGGSKKPLVAASRADALKEIDACQAFGARMLVYGEPDYPQMLLSVPDAPPVITVMGHIQLWKKDVVAMVGARNASAHGCQFASRLAKELGNAGLSIASGLARGIDSFVHRGSLASGTIAVIAGGIDNIYPPENEVLFKQIRETGVVISEQPFGSIPFAGAFPGRNRIIAGMSLATVVVEASPKSGSLITARLAHDYHREVLAVPGSPLDPRSKGCNMLIKQGASMVESGEDVLAAIASTRRRVLEESPATHYLHEEAAMPQPHELESIRLILLDKLGSTPVLIDELIEQCDTSAPAILTVLLELELAGRLKRIPGNKVYLSEKMEEVA